MNKTPLVILATFLFVITSAFAFEQFLNDYDVSDTQSGFTHGVIIKFNPANATCPNSTQGFIIYNGSGVNTLRIFNSAGTSIANNGFTGQYVSFQLNYTTSETYYIGFTGSGTFNSRKKDIPVPPYNGIWVNYGCFNVSYGWYDANPATFPLDSVTYVSNRDIWGINFTSSTTSPGASNFSITANNTVTGTAVTTFNATIDGILYTTTTGTITTHILQNSTSLWNINLTSPNLYDVQLNNVNVSSNLVAQFTTTTLTVNSYNGYIAYGGTNYVRNLSYSVTANQCRGTPQLHRLINGISNNYTVLDCSLNSSSITGHYINSAEGFYNISFLINGSTTIQTNTSQTAFFEDLNNPTIVLLNHTFAEGFTTDLNVSVSMNCTDTYPNLNYSMYINTNLLFKQNVTSGTLQTNTTILNDGATNLTAYCSDPFGTDTEQISFIAYSKKFLLINEITGLPFVVSNITNAKIWFGDNSTYYDLKAHNVNNVSVLSSNVSEMRVELEYSTGDIITRYLDMGLLTEPTVYICANTEGVIHYEQIAISSLEKPVIIKNIFSKCYIAADYTRFAYQNALILKSYSINSNYYIYTFDEGRQVTLASLDGSISTYINIDTLEFNKAGTTLTIQQDGLAFKKTGTSEVSIYYNNLGADNIAVNLSIYRQDTGELVYTQDDFTDKNEFTVIFDWASLFNVTDKTLFKAELIKTNDQGTESFNRYFTTQGSTGFIPTGVGMAVSLLLIIFGLSWTAARITFSWFGIFICLAAIVILAFTTTAWYVTFLMFMEIIICVYCVIIMMKQNYSTVA